MKTIEIERIKTADVSFELINAIEQAKKITNDFSVVSANELVVMKLLSKFIKALIFIIQVLFLQIIMENKLVIMLVVCFGLLLDIVVNKLILFADAIFIR